MQALAVPERLICLFRRNVSHEVIDARQALARQNQRISHAAAFTQARLDLRRLDPIAVQIDLIVDPPAELDAPVG